MNPGFLVFAILSMAAATAAQAQVYRCPGEALYTDQPCEGAAPVDTRANILDPGPRGFPPPPVPQPALILPWEPRRMSSDGGSSGSTWSDGGRRESEFRANNRPSGPAPGAPMR